MGKEKYKQLKIEYPYEDLEAMDKEKCDELYKKFIESTDFVVLK